MRATTRELYALATRRLNYQVGFRRRLSEAERLVLRRQLLTFRRAYARLPLGGPHTIDGRAVESLRMLRRTVDGGLGVHEANAARLGYGMADYRAICTHILEDWMATHCNQSEATSC